MSAPHDGAGFLIEQICRYALADERGIGHYVCVRGILGVLVVVVIASACSSRHHASLASTTRPRTSSLMIVFRRDASTSQEAAVRSQLAADSRVASFTYRAANDGYAITGSEFPASTAVVSRGATAPSTITIRLTSGADAAAFVAQYERQPGVAVVGHYERLPGETASAAAP